MALDLVPLWTVLLGARGVLLRGVRRLRSRRRHPLRAWCRTRGQRSIVMNSIAPVWDGNETWLVFGGIGLLAAFPLAFAIIIPAVYFPILLMLLALVFRGVAFEFRFKHPAIRRFWDRAFCGGSVAGDLRARHRSRHFHPGLQGGRPAIRRHLIRLGQPVSARHRLGADVRLRPVGRRLAHPQDRRRVAGLGAPRRPRVPRRGHARHPRRQRLDADDPCRYRAAMVQLAEYRLALAGAGRSPR